MADNLQIIAAKLRLGLEDVDPYATARDAIAQGQQGGSFRRLADERAMGAELARSILRQALEEAGVPSPTSRQAVGLLARVVASQILSGEVAPLEGASRIWNIATQVDDEFPELDTFLYAAYEARDRPEDRARFVDGVIEAARDLVSRQHL